MAATTDMHMTAADVALQGPNPFVPEPTVTVAPPAIAPTNPIETPATAELLGLVKTLATQVGQLTSQVNNQAPLNKPQGSIISWGSSSVQSGDTEEGGDVDLPEVYDNLFPTQEATHRQVPRYRSAWREACKGFTALCNATNLMKGDELIGTKSLLLAAAQHVGRQREGVGDQQIHRWRCLARRSARYSIY